MYRGTTPTFIFKLCNTELNLDTLTQIWITIRDGRGNDKTWNISSVTVDNENKEISLFLTQAETLALCPGSAAVQIRMLTSDGKAITTVIAPLTINNVLKDGVIE